MTHSEIAFYMADINKPVCGFYLPEQLPHFTKKKNIITTTLGLGTLFTTTVIYGQTNTIIKPQTYQSENNKTKDVTTILKTENIKKVDTIFIKGKIKSIDSLTKEVETIGFASIIIKEMKIGVSANEKGEFKLPFHPLKDSGIITLSLGAVAYNAKQIDVEYKDQTEIDLGIITMQKNLNIIEYYVIVRKRTKLGNLWRKITKPFRRH
jgi:hypothetical protein